MLPCFAAADLERLGVERRERQQFIKPDGSVIERWTGAVIIHAAGSSTIGDVIFGEPGDPVVLGWHTLSGLNRVVDARSEQLIDGGPIVAASAASGSDQRGAKQAPRDRTNADPSLRSG